VDLPDPLPPPTPFERGAALDPTASSTSGPPRRRRRVRVIAALLLVGTVAAGGWLALRDGGFADQRSAAGERTRDSALLALLIDIEQSEGAMLGYYDALRDELGDPTVSREQALDIIAAAAVEAASQLREVRALIVPVTGDAVVDDVRAAYLPHLDSWVDYLDAVAEMPELELERDRAAPFNLVINATARAFRVATEEMLATGPSEEVRQFAEDILDEGFRGFDDEAQT
jgi:hypothetical protein